ncbi:MAG: PspC domain-containing protein [Egibacteraceae bacterium]
MSDTTPDQPHGQATTDPGGTDAGTPRAQAEAPDAPTGPATRILTRRTGRRVLGGVASGLAAYFDIDPIIARLAFVAFGFAIGPVAILLYLIAWLIVPPDTDPYRPRRRAMPTWAWIVLAVFGLLLLPALVFGSFGPGFDGPGSGGRGFGGPGFDGRGFGGPGFDGPGFWRPGFFWVLILVGLGVLLFRRSERATASSLEGGGDAATLPSSTTSARPARPPSILGRLVVAVGLLIAGLAAVADNFGLLDLSARRLVALLMVIVGIGLLVGAWWGSARWLIAIGAALIPILLVTSVFSFAHPGRPFRGEFSDRVERPTLPTQVTDPFELGFGGLTLDLTALPLTDDPTEVAADVIGGRIVVLVPDDAAVDVQARVGGGEFDIFDEQLSGRGLVFNDAHPGAAGGGRLALDLEVDRGEIVVREQAVAAPSPSPQASPSS